MRITSLKLESVKDLLIAELRDLHNAEEQLVEALPKMAEAASSTELKNAFNHHLEETRKHVSRLDEVFKCLGEHFKPGAMRPSSEFPLPSDRTRKRRQSINPVNPNVDIVSFGLRILFHDAAPAYQVDNAWALPSPRFEMLSVSCIAGCQCDSVERHSSFKTRVRTCSKRWAPRSVHRICCFFTIRLLTT